MRVDKVRIKVSKTQTGVKVEGDGAELTYYIIENTKARRDVLRPAVIICPGGAYEFCSDRESHPVALQFLAKGYHAFVLNYSTVPNRFPTALMELASAVVLIRKWAGEWMVDTNRIIVCGFSAGGHLAASLGVFWDKLPLYGALNLPMEEIRPNGLILSYPVISFGEFGHTGTMENLLGDMAGDEELLSLVSLEKQVSDKVPPVFLWHTYTDTAVPVENSLLFAGALKKYHVSLELHIFPDGCHGLALANEETDNPGNRDCIVPQCQVWIDLAGEWIRSLRG